jgi:hypothetical protein
MTHTANSLVVPSRRSHTGIPPVAWVVIGVATMGVARAVEGIVEIGREILASGPTGPGGEAAAQPPVKRASHEMAGIFLILASVYAVRFARRAVADVEDVASEMGLIRS